VDAGGPRVIGGHGDQSARPTLATPAS
jgi:hypothetical protein